MRSRSWLGIEFNVEHHIQSDQKIYPEKYPPPPQY